MFHIPSIISARQRADGKRRPRISGKNNFFIWQLVFCLPATGALSGEPVATLGAQEGFLRNYSEEISLIMPCTLLPMPFTRLSRDCRGLSRAVAPLDMEPEVAACLAHPPIMAEGDMPT